MISERKSALRNGNVSVLMRPACSRRLPRRWPRRRQFAIWRKYINFIGGAPSQRASHIWQIIEFFGMVLPQQQLAWVQIITSCNSQDLQATWVDYFFVSRSASYHSFVSIINEAPAPRRRRSWSLAIWVANVIRVTALNCLGVARVTQRPWSSAARLSSNAALGLTLRPPPSTPAITFMDAG